MAITRDQVEKTEARRFQFLMQAYELLHEDYAHRFVEAEVLGQSIGLDDPESYSVAKYLVDRGLLKWVGMVAVAITTEGLIEVEEATKRPEQETEFFPANIYNISIGEMKDSMIQQGSPGASQSQMINRAVDALDLAALIDDLRAAVGGLPGDSDLKGEAGVQFQTIEVQAKAKNPQPGVVGGALQALAGLFKTVPGYVAGVEAAKMIDVFLAAHHLVR